MGVRPGSVTERGVVVCIMGVPERHKPIIESQKNKLAEQNFKKWLKAIVCAFLSTVPIYIIHYYLIGDKMSVADLIAYPYFICGVLVALWGWWSPKPPIGFQNYFRFYPDFKYISVTAPKVQSNGSAAAVVGFVVGILKYMGGSMDVGFAFFLMIPGVASNIVGCWLREGSKGQWEKGGRGLIASLMAFGGAASGAVGFIVMIYIAGDHQLGVKLYLTLIAAGTCMYLLCFVLNESHGWRSGTAGVCMLIHMFGAGGITLVGFAGLTYTCVGTAVVGPCLLLAGAAFLVAGRKLKPASQATICEHGQRFDECHSCNSVNVASPNFKLVRLTTQKTETVEEAVKYSIVSLLVLGGKLLMVGGMLIWMYVITGGDIFSQAAAADDNTLDLKTVRGRI